MDEKKKFDRDYVALAAWIIAITVMMFFMLGVVVWVDLTGPERITNGTAVYAGGETCNVSMDPERSRQAIVEDFKFCLSHHRIYLASE